MRLASAAPVLTNALLQSHPRVTASSAAAIIMQQTREQAVSVNVSMTYAHCITEKPALCGTAIQTLQCTASTFKEVPYGMHARQQSDA